MTTTDPPVSILADCLRELCESSRPGEALRGVTLHSLQQIDRDDFPSSLRPSFEQFMKRLQNHLQDDAFSSANGEDGAGAREVENPGPLIEDIIDFYGVLQTHRAPVLDRDWFLDHLESSSEKSSDLVEQKGESPEQPEDFTSLFLRV